MWPNISNNLLLWLGQSRGEGWSVYVAQYSKHDGLYLQPNISRVAAAIREAQSLIWTAFVAQHSISTRMVYSYLLKQQLHKKSIIAKWARNKAQHKKYKKRTQAKAQGLVGFAVCFSGSSPVYLFLFLAEPQKW